MLLVFSRLKMTYPATQFVHGTILTSIITLLLLLILPETYHVLAQILVASNKCCPADHFLDTTTYICRSKANATMTSDFTHSFPKCPTGHIISTVKINASVADVPQEISSSSCSDTMDKYSNDTITMMCLSRSSVTKKPSLRKCCKMGQTLMRSGDCASSSLPLNFHFYDITNGSISLTSHVGISNFDLILGDICLTGNKYPLFIENITYYILTNGTLWIPDAQPPDPTLLTHQDFCIETVDHPFLVDHTPDAFVCFKPDNGVGLEQQTIEVTALIFSCICLLLTLIYYLHRRKKNNWHSWALMTYIFCLFIAFACLTLLRFSSQQLISYPNLCELTAMITLFFFMSSFLWLNVLSIDIWKKVRAVRSYVEEGKRRKILKYVMYATYAWGTALVITFICFLFEKGLIDIDEDYRPLLDNCWLSKESNGFLIFFVIPAFIPTLVNSTLSIFTAWRCYRVKSAIRKMHKDQGESNKFSRKTEQFCLILKLFLVMGVTWIFESLSSLKKFTEVPQWIWWPTDAINHLHGVIIFFIVVLRKRRIRSVQAWFCRHLGISRWVRNRHNSTPNESNSLRTTCSTTLLQSTGGNSHTKSYF